MSEREEAPVRVLAGEAMAEPEVFAFGTGAVAVYSCGKPGAEKSNEDGAALLTVGAGRGVLAVVDGVGGHAGGERAAALVLDHLQRSLFEDAGGDSGLRAPLLDAIEAANAALLEKGAGSAATLAAVTIEDGAVRPFHVGDAEILVVGQRGHVRLQVVPHSPIGYAVESGMLAPAAAIAHEDRHLVSNVVGDLAMRIEVGSSRRLRPRDTVLLASDGLFDNLRLAEIVERMRTGSIRRAADALARLARKRMQSPDTDQPAKPDDLTFVLYRPTVQRGDGVPVSAEGAT